MHCPDPIRHPSRCRAALPVARGARIALALSAAVTAGCASLGEQPGRIAIASDPPGAEVYVMGRRVGVTPLSVEQRLIFPPTYPSDQQALYGMVELRRTGCTPVQRAVSVRGVARGVEVKLDCAAGTRPAAEAAPAAVPAAAPTIVPAAAPRPDTPAATVPPGAAPSATTAAIEARLRRVQELRERGVISEQEAQEQRRRILGEL